MTNYYQKRMLLCSVNKKEISFTGKLKTELVCIKQEQKPKSL